MKTLIFLILTIPGFANADSLFIELEDIKNDEMFEFSLDPVSFETTSRDNNLTAIPDARNGDYYVKDEHLVLGEVELIDANELLFQARIKDIDILFVREEYNSLSSPLKLLSAFSGHPVQVSKIYIVAVKHGSVINKKRLQKRDSSYLWSVKLSYAN